MDKSMIKKRGRPPITKDYPNPLQSPMAHSSMQVQKQGPHSFAKPLMKVGQSSPSPNKRRLSIDHHHNLAATTRKGRYRGVLLSTPTKKSSTNGSTPISTPSSNDSYNNTVFSETRKTFLQSSPPIMTSSPAFQKKMTTCFLHRTIQTFFNHYRKWEGRYCRIFAFLSIVKIVSFNEQ